jgi:hypothetical protein
MQSSGSFRLVVRRGPEPNKVYELDKDVMTIGRDINNDITINDPEISRRHCRFTRGGGGYTLEDLVSTNGTFVNNQRLSGARPLSSGDIISLGETVVLAYESVSLASEPGVGMREQQDPAIQPTVQGRVPPPPASPAQQPPQPAVRARGYYEPPASQVSRDHDYGRPAAPAYDEEPYEEYDYSEEPLTGGVERWIFLAFGCFIVLCIISSIVGVIIIDVTDSWCDVPVVQQFTEVINDIFFDDPNRCDV